MKKLWLTALALCLLLTGCGDRRMETRWEDFSAALRERETLGFTAALRAEYDDRSVEMTLRYARSDGVQRVTVLEPAIIAGIGAALRDGETQLEYDGIVLDTGPLDRYGLCPLSALPRLVEALCRAQPDSCWQEGGETVYLLVIDDNCRAQVWFDEDMRPVHAELLSDGAVRVVCEIHDWS